ncbi:MAG: NHL repeat-containing protein [Candidatus Eremiobacteraeota bacterium]|nr:NHL repeat-containing protein [Candidatus Eremiobacteraeota bacterium]
MLRRLTIGLFTLATAVVIAACSSSDTSVPSSGGVPGIGPNFTTGTIYVSNGTQNAISIYSPSPGPSATPAYQIGGASTGLSGPQYLAFDSAKRLYVTNFNASTSLASVQVYQTFATGNVIPFTTLTGASFALTHPNGIAIDKTGEVVVANTGGASPYSDSVRIIPTGLSTASPAPPFTVQATLGGSNTLMSAPTGVALDAAQNIYVANRGNGTVTVYAFPSPTPTPAATSTPVPTPTPSTTPSPTPTPIPFAFNQPPIARITGLGAPTGIAVDSAGKIYVADPDSGSPSVNVYNPIAGGTATLAAQIKGAATGLNFPSDVKVDNTGNIYVVDSAASKLFIFAPGANGNVTPTIAITYAGGTPVGIALSP